VRVLFKGQPLTTNVYATFTVVWSGWQGDVPPGADRLTARFPIIPGITGMVVRRLEGVGLRLHLERFCGLASIATLALLVCVLSGGGNSGLTSLLGATGSKAPNRSPAGSGSSHAPGTLA
jgi:hypothetical protein